MKSIRIVVVLQLLWTAAPVDPGAFAADVIAAAPPVIASFTPDSGRPGTGVYVTGDNLELTSSVEFNGIEATFTNLVSTGGVILAEVPRNASTGPISVVTPAGRATSSAPFTVIRLAPVISGFTPTSGPVGTKVTITGSNLFEPNITVVKFNGAQAQSFAGPLNPADPELIALVPANATTGPISVETSSGAATTTAAFTVTNVVYLPPVITRFTPTHGTEGESVRLEGFDLTGVLSIQFNGVEADFYQPDYQPDPQNPVWTAKVPPKATSGPIRITTKGGTNTTATAFVVEPLAVDLGLEVMTSAQPIRLGELLTYSILVTNRGTPQAHGVVLTDELPPGATLVSAIASQGAFSTSGNEVTGRLGELAGHAAAAVNLRVRFEQSGILSNTASVAADEMDPDAANNTVTTSTRVVGLDELMIRALANGQVELSWPTQAVSFVVQSVDRLSASPVWTTLGSPSAIVQGRHVVIDTVSGAGRFYRLSAP